MADEISLYINFNDSSYIEGEEVSGNVICELLDDLVIESLTLELYGYAKVKWPRPDSSQRSQPRHPFVLEEDYLNQRQILYKQGEKENEILVQSGTHKYPFRIQLPNVLPSTFLAEHGGIEYWARVKLERPWKHNHTVKKRITITSVVDLNSLPKMMTPVELNSEEHQTVMCCTLGQIVCSWYLERIGYLPGETIHFKGEVKNNSGRSTKRSKVVLMQNVRYYDQSGKTFHERKTLAMVSKGQVRARSTDRWKEKIKIPLDLPPTGLKSCSLIDLYYTLKFKVTVNRVQKITTNTDIVIGTIGLNQESPFSAEDSPAEPEVVDISYFV
ncbi:DgyrCDS13304 [Dimorphilus gyrociliatus]|uniref:DgyrCDS13304 n=1 Tax=Dimorphilus gyrociliatus TaxID=2664684 RepID=A0A7I8WA94_9ANNE|nr:DgyrCDS13304 [Dimorphilus gyrociliatus]